MRTDTPVKAYSAPKNRIEMVASKSDMMKPHLHQSSAWTTFNIRVTHHGKVELVLYRTTRATMKDTRKTMKYQLLGASRYLYAGVHVGRMKLPR
jgi:hypothetical protein